MGYNIYTATIIACCTCIIVICCIICTTIWQYTCAIISSCQRIIITRCIICTAWSRYQCCKSVYGPRRWGANRISTLNPPLINSRASETSERITRKKCISCKIKWKSTIQNSITNCKSRAQWGTIIINPTQNCTAICYIRNYWICRRIILRKNI